MDVAASSTGVLGLQMQNQSLRTNGEAMVALVKDAAQAGEQAQNTTKAAISNPNVGTKVDVSA